MIDFKRKRPWSNIAWILAFWIVVILIMVGQTTSGFTEWSRVVVQDVADYGLWVLVSLMIYALSARYAIGNYSGFVLAPLYAAIGLVVAFCVDTVHTVAHLSYVHRPGRRWPIMDALSEQAADELFNLHELEYLIYTAIVLAILAARAHQRSRERQLNEERLSAQLTEARLIALRTQLNPHFLFNTLHAVTSFVESRPEVVNRLIARLSDLLRYTLHPSTEHEVTLTQELKLLGYYLDILLIRFESHLDIQKEIDPGVLDTLVPDLILQPLVENAVEHGISRSLGEGIIRISANRDGETVLLSVRDNGGGFDAFTKEGMGLQNTRGRLQQLYGSDAHLDLLSNDDGGTTVTIALPYHTSNMNEQESDT